jgi:hypothetical protein
MPKGRGGYKEIGLYLDTASQSMFGFKYKTHGSAKTTTKALQAMFQGHTLWEVSMSDGGSHFDNEEVRQLCAEFGVETEVVAKYSPWVNGLVEGTNRILLEILKRMCALDLGEEGWKMMEKWEDLPANWPEHFDNTIFLLNNHILRALDHTPNKLFFGMVINTTATGMETAARDISLDDIEAQQAYVQQQRFDGHVRAVAQKKAFDKKVLSSKAGEVVFKAGDLVQVLDPKFKKMFFTMKKILSEWSGTFRVKENLLNSYTIETIYGQELDRKYSARRLQPLKAPAGSSLEAFEIARKAGLEPREGLDGRAPGIAVRDKVQSRHKEDEPNEDKEDMEEDNEEDDDEGEG